MKIMLLLTGKTTDRKIADLMDIYSSRIKRYCSFEVVCIPDIKNTRNMPAAEVKKYEGEKILSNLLPDDQVFLLDERGTEFRTLAFASFLEKRFLISSHRIVFVTGGAYGFANDVYERASQNISLSKMTFPHQLVRLLFLEQLYRAFTIIKGEPYHHE